MRLPVTFGFILILLAGCASLAKPESFEQRLAYGYGTVTAVRKTATDLLKQDKITVDQAKFVQAKADESRKYLDLARGLPQQQAQDNLQLALNILTALEVALKEYQ